MLLRVLTTLPQRNRVIMRSKKDDPDDQRRINENKKWKAGDPEEDAWDIDKERDAVMYKREALEACLRTEYIEKERKEDEEDEQGLEK